MPGLNRIILIDTHLPDVVELKLDGHTNICGTNASGKTTLQRLIPVFYGEYPSRVVPATRDSFEKWYLPRTSSYIIYEYTRFEGDLCQAVLSSTGTGVNYRFIGKPFDRSDYLLEQKNGEFVSVGSAELARVLKRNGIMVSSQLSTKDFRAVIQNDQSVLTQSSHARELLGYARVFSLTDTANPVRHIEKLAKAVHSKEGKMETIKTMIAAIMEEDGVQPPTSNLSRQRVDDWIGECALIKSFDGIRPQFLQLEQAHLGLEQTEAQLQALQGAFENDSAQLETAQTQYAEQMETVAVDLKQEEALWRSDQDSLNQTISAARADIDKHTSDLDTIEDEYAAWQDKNIEQLKEDVEQLPHWERALENAEKRYDMLTGEHQDTEATFNRRLAEMADTTSAALDELQAQRMEQSEALAQHKQEAQNKEQEVKARFAEQLQKLNDEHNEQAQSLKLQQAETQSALKNAGFNAFEQSQLDLLDAAIKEAQSVEDSAQDDVRAERQTLSQTQEKRDIARRDLDEKRDTYRKAQSVVDEVNRLLFPGEGTLLEFLRAGKPDWPITLGKVIKPELLESKKLNPRLVDAKNENHENTNFFGVELDLESVVEPEAGANESALQEKLQAAETQLNDALVAQNASETELAQANEAVRNAELSLTQKENAAKSAQANRKRMQRDRDAQLNEYQVALQERKQTAQKKLSNIESSLKKLKNQHEQEQESLADQQRDAVTEQTFHWQQVMEDAQASIQRIDSQIATLKKDAENEKASLRAWLENELNNKGVDVDEIGQLKKDVAKYKADISRTQRDRHLVSDYTRWYDTVFKGHKVQAQQSLEKARKQLSESERELASRHGQFKQLRESLSERKTELEQLTVQTKQDLESVRTLLRAVKKLDLNATEKTVELTSAAASLSQRISLAQSALQDRDEHNKNVRDYVDMFDQMIAAQAGTGLSDTWEKARSECSVMIDDGSHRVEHRKLVPHLSQLLNVIVPQKIQGLKEQGRIFGADLSQYYHVLVDIDKRIARQSQRLTKEVDSELYLDGVSNSAVKIRSRISELEFWPELEKFKQEYESWMEEGADSLPAESYGQSMRHVLDILGRAALSGGISKLLDIELHLREGESDLVIRTDRQLNESSSHGMAYLILCKFLLAFTRLLRADAKVTVHWPIDELGTLHQTNIKKIFDACQNNQISVVGAFPNPESEVLTLFVNRYLIDKGTKRLQVVQPKISALSKKLAARRQTTETVA